MGGEPDWASDASPKYHLQLDTGPSRSGKSLPARQMPTQFPVQDCWQNGLLAIFPHEAKTPL